MDDRNPSEIFSTDFNVLYKIQIIGSMDLSVHVAENATRVKSEGDPIIYSIKVCVYSRKNI